MQMMTHISGRGTFFADQSTEGSHAAYWICQCHILVANVMYVDIFYTNQVRASELALR